MPLRHRHQNGFSRAYALLRQELKGEGGRKQSTNGTAMHLR